MKKCDICVIGSGPAGLKAAVKAAKQKKLDVILVEKADIGGICLNAGCIPTKSLLHSASVLHNISTSSHFLTNSEQISFNFFEMQKLQKSIVYKFKEMLLAELKTSNVTFLTGIARFKDENTIEVSDEEITAKHFIIASGASSRKLKMFEACRHNVLVPEELFNLSELPDTLLIVGAGAIGCEYADFFSSLGVAVTLVEQKDSILPGLDPDISKRLQIFLRKKGVSILTGETISESLSKGNQVSVCFSSETKLFDKVFVAVGKDFNTKSMGLSEAKVNLNSDGSIAVDNFFKTSNKNIWAIGDVIGKKMLAHAADKEAESVIHNIFGDSVSVNYSLIPDVIYTYIEAASIGAGFKELENSDVLRVIKGRFGAVARSYIEETSDGIFKIFYEQDSRQIKGAVLYCKGAGELISFFSLAIQKKTTLEELKNVVFPHPTVTEAISISLDRE